MKQNNLFSDNNIDTVIINESGPPESRSNPVAMKATFSEKEFLNKLAYAEGITIAELIRRATKFYIEWYEHEGNLRKYRDAIVSLMEKLP